MYQIKDWNYLGNPLELDVFDKKTEFPFQVKRYPHFDSIIPTSILYGMFAGLLYRRYQICTCKSVFLQRSVELAQTLLDKLCSKRWLCKLFSKFMYQKVPLRWSVSTSSLVRQFSTRLGNF